MCPRTLAVVCCSIFCVPIFIGYAVGLGSNFWVSAGNYTWGLWKWCDVNETVCHTINPGDSPGYFEGVRTLAIAAVFLQVIFGISLCFFYDTIGPPLAVFLFYCLSVVTAPVLLATNYKTDDRWKGSNPSLGWGFKLTWSCAGIFFLFFLFIVTSRLDRTVPPRPPSPPGKRRRLLWCCGPDPALPTVTRRPSNASSTLSIDTGKRITIFHSHTSPLSIIETDPSRQPRDLSGCSRDVVSIPPHSSNNRRDIVSTNQGDVSSHSPNVFTQPRDVPTNLTDVSTILPPGARQLGIGLTNSGSGQYPVLSIPGTSLPRTQGPHVTRIHSSTRTKSDKGQVRLGGNCAPSQI